MTVNKERVQLLVDALRSGDFKQGLNMLRTNDDTYCCLGVACEVARLNGLGIDWVSQETSCDCEDCSANRWKFNGSGEALGEDVANWYGFEDDGYFVNDPQLGPDEQGRTLTAIRANDDYGWNFDQIADALEKKYLNEEESK